MGYQHRSSASNAIAKRSAGIVGAAGLTLLLLAAPPAAAQPHAQADVPACFVHKEHCTGEIVGVLDGARTEIRAQALAFSSRRSPRR
jgi:hypothetical protein